jgi:hypothetical protein
MEFIVLAILPPSLTYLGRLYVIVAPLYRDAKELPHNM